MCLLLIDNCTCAIVPHSQIKPQVDRDPCPSCGTNAVPRTSTASANVPARLIVMRNCAGSRTGVRECHPRPRSAGGDARMVLGVVGLLLPLSTLPWPSATACCVALLVRSRPGSAPRRLRCSCWRRPWVPSPVCCCRRRCYRGRQPRRVASRCGQRAGQEHHRPAFVLLWLTALHEPPNDLVSSRIVFHDVIGAGLRHGQRSGPHPVCQGLLEEVLIDLLDVEDVLHPAADRVADHQPGELLAVDQHDPLAEEVGGFPR